MKTVLVAAAFAVLATVSHAGDGGIIRKESAQGVSETVDALVTTLEGAGLKIFAKVDHGAGAVSVGEDVGASQLLIFGSPKVGTPAIKDDPLAGLYLPLKILVFEDDAGKAWIAYEDPKSMLTPLGGVGETAPYLDVMTGALAKFSGSVSQ